MRTNQAGLEIIKKYEGLRLHSYQDAGGVWTIGYGHTKGVEPGQEISKERAVELLVEDLRDTEKSVDSLIRAPLNFNQFSALVSLVFNIGHGHFQKSTLRCFLNQGRYGESAKEFLRWKLDNRYEVRGLLARREEEIDLFLTPSSVPPPTPHP